MVKYVIVDLDSSKLSGVNCISVMALRNCEPKLLYILANSFDICLKELMCSECS